MKVYIIIAMMFFGTVCNAQATKSMNFTISIYPSSGGEIGYLIDVRNEKFRISSKKLKIAGDKIILGESVSTEDINLSKHQFRKIECYISKVQEIQNIDRKSDDIILDVWFLDFVIGQKRKINTNTKDLASDIKLKYAKKLLKYLQEISKTDIDLKGFS